MSDPPSDAAPTDSPAATADDAPLERLGFAIGRAFPRLEAIEPVRWLGEGWDSVAVETAGGIVFRFPKREATAVALAKEAQLLPFLRGALTVDIPVPEWKAGATTEHPWGFAGYRRVPGAALRATAIQEDNVEQLAREIARFLNELHQFPVERAVVLGVPSARDWRPSYERLRTAVMPPLRRRLTLSEYGRLRRWWTDFLSNGRTWDFAPALVHRDLGVEHLLVDVQARTLLGVIDWGDAAIGDPAIDFAGLVTACGSKFAWRVTEAYRAFGGIADADLFTRVRRYGPLVPIHAVRFSARGGNVDSGMEEAVARLRAGPILSG